MPRPVVLVIGVVGEEALVELRDALLFGSGVTEVEIIIVSEDDLQQEKAVWELHPGSEEYANSLEGLLKRLVQGKGEILATVHGIPDNCVDELWEAARWSCASELYYSVNLNDKNARHWLELESGESDPLPKYLAYRAATDS